jgi:hypothetical protein
MLAATSQAKGTATQIQTPFGSFAQHLEGGAPRPSRRRRRRVAPFFRIGVPMQRTRYEADGR